MSNEPVTLILKTGIIQKHSQSQAVALKAREIHFSLPRSYITWQFYLTDEPQSSFEIEAVIPSYEPYYPLKKQLQAIGEKPSSKHQLWLPITLSITRELTPSYCHNGFCGQTPSEKGYNFYSNRFGRNCKTETPGFSCRHTNADTHPYIYPECRGMHCELLLPIQQPDLPLTYLICGKITEIIEMCEVSTQYDLNIRIIYKIQKMHLVNFSKIDSGLKKFIKNHIIQDLIVVDHGNWLLNIVRYFCQGHSPDYQ